jgi:pilus assembly protein TadC
MVFVPDTMQNEVGRGRGMMREQGRTIYKGSECAPRVGELGEDRRAILSFVVALKRVEALVNISLGSFFISLASKGWLSCGSAAKQTKSDGKRHNESCYPVE